MDLTFFSNISTSFLCLFLFWIIIELVCFNSGYLSFGYFVFLISLLFVSYGYEINLFLWVFNHPITTLKFIGGYLIIGGGWSLIKWYIHLCNIRAEIKTNLKKNRTSLIKKSSENYLSYEKNEIIGWITYWPFSIMDTLFGNIPEIIYRNMVQIYERMAHYMLSDLIEEAHKPIALRKSPRSCSKSPSLQ